MFGREVGLLMGWKRGGGTGTGSGGGRMEKYRCAAILLEQQKAKASPSSLSQRGRMSRSVQAIPPSSQFP